MSTSGLLGGRTRPPSFPKGARDFYPAGGSDPSREVRRDLLALGGAPHGSGLDRRQAPLFSLAHFLCIHVAAVTRTMEITTNTAESAFTSGVTAVLSMP